MCHNNEGKNKKWYYKFHGKSEFLRYIVKTKFVLIVKVYWDEGSTKRFLEEILNM